MGTQHFKVELTDYSVSVDEWRRAQSAPKDDLPELNVLQREVATKFGISEEKYARSVLAGQYGVQRIRTRAGKLGEETEKILQETCAECRVVRVVADMARERWVIVLRTRKRQFGITIAREVGDDLLDFSALGAVEELKAKVKAGLGMKG
jgi:hypothetical protein